MITMTDAQVLDRLVTLRREAEEVLTFAEKRDKLTLYRAAEIDWTTLNRAIEIVQERLKALTPQPPR